MLDVAGAVVSKELQRDLVALDVSPDTVMCDWRLAKLWLLRELRQG